MKWILVMILCVTVVEMAIRLPLTSVVLGISSIGQRALRDLNAKDVSDERKEGLMLIYAILIFKATLKLLAVLLLLFAVAACLSFVFDYIGVPTTAFVTSRIGLLYTTVIASAYFFARRWIDRSKV